ncbi:DUF4358 domain-containing protein [Bacillus sp. AGMB 02131]|uniref:DUF4358 domain-containing protein n=1 Tax=Peribacillus faecalis TaxID=2772559 RepID=A0A927CVB2_9BACI|nr:DUF4358 domain-containing protein [Peribacillus faecalis]MBD3108468.1 DUF4358 domain-containing protein [Peribacillus faecalis]
MKKITVALLLTFISVILFGCGGNANDEKEVSLSETIDNIKEQIASDLEAGGVENPLVDGQLLGYTLTDLTSDSEEATMYAEKLNLDSELINAGYILVPMMNVKSDEIILLEAKDEGEVESLKQVLEQELQAQIDTWERYLPDQYEKVKKNEIKTNGRYLLYVTYDHPEKIVKIFNEQF